MQHHWNLPVQAVYCPDHLPFSHLLVWEPIRTWPGLQRNERTVPWKNPSFVVSYCPLRGCCSGLHEFSVTKTKLNRIESFLEIRIYTHSYNIKTAIITNTSGSHSLRSQKVTTPLPWSFESVTWFARKFDCAPQNIRTDSRTAIHWSSWISTITIWFHRKRTAVSFHAF